MNGNGKTDGARQRVASPHDIRTVSIGTSLLGGYDKRQVDTILIALAEDSAWRDGTIMSQAAKLAQQERKLFAYRHGHLPDSGYDEEAIRERQEAQDYADLLVAAAQDQAAQHIQDGKMQAQDEAEALLHAARTEAERLAADLRLRAADGLLPTREELRQLVALAQLVRQHLVGLKTQIDATASTTGSELDTIIGRLAPVLGTSGGADHWKVTAGVA